MGKVSQRIMGSLCQRSLRRCLFESKDLLSVHIMLLLLTIAEGHNPIRLYLISLPELFSLAIIGLVTLSRAIAFNNHGSCSAYDIHHGPRDNPCFWFAIFIPLLKK